MGYTEAPGDGGGSVAWTSPSRALAPIAEGGAFDEFTLGPVGPVAMVVTAFWIANQSADPIVASNSDGLLFTVNCRAAGGGTSATDFATTASDPGINGVGSVAIYGVGTWTLAAPLAAPAGGSITIASEIFGSGIALADVVVGVHMRPA